MTVQLTIFKPISLILSCTFTVALSMWGIPSLAGDPFRSSNPHQIGDKTEAAFEALFEKGNYKEAKRYLIEANQTEASEPLSHAMRASLAYTEKDWETLKTYAKKTIETAKKMQSQDPLRGNLYLAVGHFLEGTYIFQKDGALSAVNKLQQVFQYLDAAEKKSPDDPEFNLIKGYLDLLLAVNLPFSSPEEAIKRFENYAAPNYLVNRGIAVAYRDLKQYDKALKFAEQALQATPENPELYYLKGQILRKQGNKDKNLSLLKQALSYFERALEKQEQLPEPVLKAVRYDQNKVQKEMSQLGQ